MSDDFFIEPNYPAPIYALYDFCWKTWFDCLEYDENIQNPPTESKKG